MEGVDAFKNVLKKSLTDYWHWDFKQNSGYISNTLLGILGYDSNEPFINGNKITLKDIIFPEDYILHNTLIAKHIESKGEIPFEFEERYYHKNGSTIWFVTESKEIEWDENGLPIIMRGVRINITPYKKREEELSKENSVLNIILNDIPQSVFWRDKNHVYLGCNKAYANSLGLKDPKDIIGTTNYDYPFQKHNEIEFYHEEDREVLKNEVPRLHFEGEIINIKGKHLWVDSSKVPLKDENGTPYGVLGIFGDITEHVKIKQELLRTSKLYNTLSLINRLLLKVRTKEELYQNVCKIITEVGDFKLAWIGEPQDNIMLPKAVSGTDTSYMENINITIDDSPEGNGPVGTCYKQQEKYVCNDFFTDNNTLPWRIKAIETGIKAIATFPIKCCGDILGVLAVYAKTQNYFQSKEVALLEEVAMAIQIGLEKIEHDSIQIKLNEANIKAKEEWERTFNAIPDLIAILDNKFNVVRANNAMINKFKLLNKNCIENKCYNLLHNTDKPVETCPHCLLLKDGKTHSLTMFEEELGGHYIVTDSPIFDKDGLLIGSVHIARDISEQKAAEKKIKQLADIIEYSNALVGITSMEGWDIYKNNAFKDALAISGADVTQFHFHEFHTPTAKLKVESMMNEIMTKGIGSCENEFLSKNGNIIPVIQTILLHRNEKGEPEYISTTAIDISELKKKEAELSKLAEDLRSLSNHLQTIKEEERKTIAKEIHDELGQNLAILKMDAVWISNHIVSDNEKLVERLKQFKDISDETVKTSRRLYNSIYPQMLEDIGLVGAIKWHSQYYYSNKDFNIQFHTILDEIELFPGNQNICLTLFRIYQECFTNILRHANANLVIIKLDIYDENVIMSIEDDGIGFIVEKVDTKLHHGLLGMRERVFALNGTLNIQSKLKKGTCTTVKIPVSNEVCSLYRKK